MANYMAEGNAVSIILEPFNLEDILYFLLNLTLAFNSITLPKFREMKRPFWNKFLWKKSLCSHNTLDITRITNETFVH